MIYRAFDHRPKLVFTVLMLIAVFFVHGLAALYSLVCFLFFFSCAESGVKRSWRNITLILPMIAVMFIFMPLNSRSGTPLVSLGSFTLVTAEAFDSFLLIAGRFVFISLLCSLMMQTTEVWQLMLALRWFRLPESAALVITLALRFIPDMSGTFRQIRESQSLRLPNPDDENSRRRPFKAIFPALVSAVVSAVRSIPVSASAIDLRGWSRKNRRTSYRKLEAGRFSLLLQFCCALFIPLIVLFLF